METDIIILVFTHYDVNGLYVFIGVFWYVPCKEGAESPYCRLTSRLISCSSRVVLFTRLLDIVEYLLPRTSIFQKLLVRVSSKFLRIELLKKQ